MPTPAASTRLPRRALALALALTLCALALATLTGCAGTAATGPGGAAAAARPAAAPDRVEPLTPAPLPALPVTVPSADGRQVTVTGPPRLVPRPRAPKQKVHNPGRGPPGRA
ncbi:ABC transporter substrate-binding protein, partial [Streptomyces vinaceus]